MKSVRSRTASPPEATYRAVVEYDGTDFCGFQFQPAERTVAGALETVLSQLFDRPIKLAAAGRTDAGVHALGQVISVVAHDAFPIDKLALALNSALPLDVSVRAAARVPDGFSARFSALERSYTYVVWNRPEPSAPARRWTHFDHRPLDLAPMRRAAALLQGRHDFASFCGVRPLKGGTTRTLHALEIERAGPLVRFHFRADGFLHRMVRVVTGTLLEIGSGRRAESELAAILAACDRRRAGVTAPAHGLYLVAVRYPDFSSAPADCGAFPALGDAFTARRSD
jgi:tRNA pseudouridine38-40 synthase